MALLHRFLRLNDTHDTCIFTFIVTRSVTRESHKDFTSKDFCHGYHRWALAFSRQDKVLGVFLLWRNPSMGMKVLVDLNFTLINREHFSENLSFCRKKVKYNVDAKAQGSRKFVDMATLENRFIDRNGEFQLEVTLSNVKSVFEHKFRLNQSIFANASRMAKFETSYFSYGSYDWSLALYPNGRSDSQLGSSGSEPQDASGATPGMIVYMNRQTGLDRSCRVKFRLRLGKSGLDDEDSHSNEDERSADSGVLDEMSNWDGKSYGWLPRGKMADFVHKGVLKLAVEMKFVHTVSQLELSVVPPNPIGVPLYDKDKQTWELEPDMHGDTLKMRLVFKDAKHVPRNHIRYVCWSASILKSHPKLRSALGFAKSDEDDPDTAPLDYSEKINLDQKVYSQYYVTDDTEVGTLMDTRIAIKEIVDPNNGFLANRTDVRVHIEWLHSCLLFQSTYHLYDDVNRLQAYQMRQDIENLRLENELLERRLVTIEHDNSD